MLHPDSKPYTAFGTRGLGQFQFKRMCFGLKNATATYVRALTHVLIEGRARFGCARVQYLPARTRARKCARMRALRAHLGQVTVRDMNTPKRQVYLSFCLVTTSLLGCYQATLNVTFRDKISSP